MLDRLTALLILAMTAPGALLAQTAYEFSYLGSYHRTNAQGVTLRVPVTHYSLLREEAKRLAITNTSDLALVYKIRGSTFGDTVDLVRRDTGQVLSTVFGFFFGKDASLLRESIKNREGTEEKSIDYVYTRQNSHSLGAAFVTRTGATLAAGGPDFRARGDMHYIVAAETGKPLRICEGRFRTGRPVKFGP